MISDDSTLSTDPQKPTVFSYRNKVVLPAGEEIFGLLTWRRVPLPVNLTCDITTGARGVYGDGHFSGAFESSIGYREADRVVSFSGSFDIHLA
jgi:hypothetical protein